MVLLGIVAVTVVVVVKEEVVLDSEAAVATHRVVRVGV